MIWVIRKSGQTKPVKRFRTKTNANKYFKKLVSGVYPGTNPYWIERADGVTKKDKGLGPFFNPSPVRKETWIPTTAVRFNKDGSVSIRKRK